MDRFDPDRDYTPVFRDKADALKHGWSAPDGGGDAVEYVRADLSDAAIQAERNRISKEALAFRRDEDGIFDVPGLMKFLKGLGG